MSTTPVEAAPTAVAGHRSQEALQMDSFFSTAKSRRTAKAKDAPSKARNMNARVKAGPPPGETAASSTQSEELPAPLQKEKPVAVAEGAKATATPSADSKPQAQKDGKVQEKAQAHPQKSRAPKATTSGPLPLPDPVSRSSGKGGQAAALKPKRHSKAAKDAAAAAQHQDIRTHFPARKSQRVPEKLQREANEQQIHAMIRQGKDDEGLRVIDTSGKGKGVIAERDFARGDYICEYAGELLTKAEALLREQQYLLDAASTHAEEMMCYMYFLKHDGKDWCVDATQSKRIGRLINHSRTQPNLVTKLFVVEGKPHLGLMACRAITKGEELLYDYGERDANTLRAMPWLKE